MSELLLFDDLTVGARWTSLGRTICEADIVNFAGMSGDFNPLHVDEQYAEQSPFGRRIAHGLLGLTWVAGLGSHSPLVRTVAFVGLQRWEFLRPAYIGDTVHVVTEVLQKEENGRRTGRVHWKRQLVNQKGEIVQCGVFETLVATRQAQKQRMESAAERLVPTSHLVAPDVPVIRAD